jgi:DNA-binding response OmpR family regulator
MGLKRLLIVDDDDAMRRLIRLNLSDGYEIIDTGDPEQALALTMEHKPDAILLDLRMPKISGIDLCRTLGSCSKTEPIPVFLVSGEPAADTQRYCKELGAAGSFEKPIDFEALRGCLARLQKQNAVPRSEVRVRLRVHIKIAGVDTHGTDFQEKAYTENVSLSGFLCSCVTALRMDSLMEIYLMEPGEQYVGKARAVRSESSVAPSMRYGFRFTEKKGPWVLD